MKKSGQGRKVYVRGKKSTFGWRRVVFGVSACVVRGFLGVGQSFRFCEKLGQGQKVYVRAKTHFSS